MTDLYQMLLDVVRWFLDIVLIVLEGLGLAGGYLYRFTEWLCGDPALWIAGALATMVLAIWAMLAGGLGMWLDRKVRARVEGRRGPRLTGPWGILQGTADWLKLLLRKREGLPSSGAAALSGALALAALALIPIGPWAKVADPEWGLVVAATLLALSPIPLALMEPRGKRHGAAAEATATGVVLLLSIASVLMVGGTASGEGLVEVQSEWGWGMVLSPLGFVLYMMVMYWVATGLAKVRSTSREKEDWPGPHRSIGRFAVAARFLGVAVMGAVVFLGGWTGPIADGAWWTLLKAYMLVVVASMFAAAMPQPTATGTARTIRNHWLPLAALNLVVIAAIVEVMV